jgi:hypothetical protein
MAAVVFVVDRVLQGKFEIIEGQIVSFKDEAVAVGRSTEETKCDYSPPLWHQPEFQLA